MYFSGPKCNKLVVGSLIWTFVHFFVSMCHVQRVMCMYVKLTKRRTNLNHIHTTLYKINISPPRVFFCICLPYATKHNNNQGCTTHFSTIYNSFSALDSFYKMHLTIPQLLTSFQEQYKKWIFKETAHTRGYAPPTFNVTCVLNYKNRLQGRCIYTSFLITNSVFIYFHSS